MPAQVDYNCSNTFCVGPYYRSKYKALRTASVCLGRMHRQNVRQDMKDHQRIVQLAYEIIKGNPDPIDLAYKIRSTALELIRKRQ